MRRRKISMLWRQKKTPLVPAAEDGRLVLALGIAMRSAGV